jgi:hypothetical protein
MKAFASAHNALHSRGTSILSLALPRAGVPAARRGSRGPGGLKSQVTGLSAFSAGIEIFLTARIRPSAGHPGEHQPGGPRDLAASRRSFRFGLQFSDGTKAAGSPGGRRADHDSEPAGPVLYPFAGGGGPHSFVSRWWTWPLPPAGPLEFVCEWPAFGIAESRTGIDAQLILDAARRSVRLWPEDEG